MSDNEYRNSADARSGADRMAAGLPCIPDRVRGDLDEVLRLRAERNALRAALQEIAENATSPYEDGWCGELAQQALDATRKP